MSEEHYIIIGNGVAGVTSALKIREKNSEAKISIISKESRYFYSRPALMYLFMGHMKINDLKPYEDWYWEQQNINLILDEVISINYHTQILSLKNQKNLKYDKLILATGSKPNKFGWPGQDLEGVQGLYHLQDLERLENTLQRTQQAVIIGGGLIGIEFVEMLQSRNIPVKFLIREEQFWGSVLPKEESDLIEKHMKDHHVDLYKSTQLKEIINNGKNEVKEIITTDGEKIPCELVGLTVGVSPNIDFLKNNDLETDRGILIDRQFKTNINNVYAIGDCAQFREKIEGRRNIEQVWYTAKMHGESLADILTQNTSHEYQPGIWWNSAKFFDIEYQTYGLVPSITPEDQESWVWTNPEQNKLLRLNFCRSQQSIKGFNFFGLRARHQVCEQWIRHKTPITEILSHLGALNFDPEFYHNYEEDIIKAFNQDFPQHQVELKSSKGLFSPFFKSLFSFAENPSK